MAPAGKDGQVFYDGRTHMYKGALPYEDLLPSTSHNSGYTKCLPKAQHRHFA